MFDRILRAFDGGRDELSRDNLVQLVVEQVASLRERGARGQSTLPPEVLVTLSVPIERVAVVRGFVSDPQFDHDVDDELVNRLATVPVHAMPLRIYEVYIGERLEVGAIGRAGSLVVRLTLTGGDRDGQVHLVPARMRTLRVGRGPWHGADQRERNDLVVSDADPFVSRRAARLRRAGAAWEVEALDQGGSLVVIRTDGTRVRPYNAPTRWVTLRTGDALEFNDNAQQAITVQIGLDRDAVAAPEPALDEWSDAETPPDEADTQ